MRVEQVLLAHGISARILLNIFDQGPVVRRPFSLNGG